MPPQEKYLDECFMKLSANITNILISFLQQEVVFVFFLTNLSFSSVVAQTHRCAGDHSSHAEVRRLVWRINAGVHCEYKNNVFSASNDA